MNEKQISERKLHYDLLRIFAAFSVVMLHSAAQYWYTLDISTTEWLVANSYDAVFRFGVPVFVMISGALFLDKDYRLDTRLLYRHNILRLVVLYFFWSALYGLWDARNYRFSEIGWKPYVREMLSGSYHLWFLPMIVGIYVILPILRTWVHHADEKNLRYFLTLFLILQIGKETLTAVTVTDELHEVLDLVQVEMICSYVGYFVWGYYLAHVGLTQKIHKLVYICFVPSILANIIISNGLSRHYGKPMPDIYDSFGLFTFLISTGLFLLFRELLGRKKFSDRSSAIIREVSANTLGIYVMHIGLLDILQLKGIDSMMLPIVIGIPMIAIMCFVICLVLAAVLRRIPVVGKYIC